MQRQRSITVFSEGWGLYAEQLAEEMGLYTGTESLLGATTAALLRAARLVVDTGLHARGWSRQEALEFFVAHVPMPPRFLAAEIDRYIIWPGQALAYLTGKLADPRARERGPAPARPGLLLPEFHAALLDSGSLPVPVLHQHIDCWSRDQADLGLFDQATRAPVPYWHRAPSFGALHGALGTRVLERGIRGNHDSVGNKARGKCRRGSWPAPRQWPCSSRWRWAPPPPPAPRANRPT